MSELNFNSCAGLVLTADSMTKVMTEGSFAEIDPEETFYSTSIGEEYIYASSEGTSYEEDESLEGQEAANAQCRAEYDDNAIAETQEGFCCQTLIMDGGAPFGTITSATKLSKEVGETLEVTMTNPVSGEEVTVEVDYGAEVFASARGLGASLAALASAALVFSQ